MSEVVSLATGERLNQAMPDTETPAAVLAQLLEDIASGRIDPTHLVVVMQTGKDGPCAGFVSRSSRMSIAEVIALLAISQRNAIHNLLAP